MNQFGQFFSGDMSFFWIVIAFVLLFVELATPGLFFFISFSGGALIAALCAYLGYALKYQAVLMLICSLGLFVIICKQLMLDNKRRVITNSDALVGKMGFVVVQIKPGQHGQIKVGGEVWAAQTVDGTVREAGCKVQVIRLQGNRLFVR